jgi:hypothetical protein
MATAAPAGEAADEEVHAMEALVLSVALLPVLAGLAKQQLECRAMPAPARRRRP